VQANSRQVSSNQPHLHHKLAAVVRRHLSTPYRRPPAEHSMRAYEAIRDKLQLQPLIVDSFCGTGHSSARLAQQYPDHLVLGIDKSAQRLARHPDSSSGNHLLLQADCEDIWQLLVRDKLLPQRHYLLYPNPWPKAKHLQRRVHGHGSFPLLLQLGGAITLRSNWQLYVEEFGLAMHLAGCRGSISMVGADPALTLFEQKYRDSGHNLWQFCGVAASSTAP